MSEHYTVNDSDLNTAIDYLKELMANHPNVDAVAIVAKHVEEGWQLDVYVLNESNPA